MAKQPKVSKEKGEITQDRLLKIVSEADRQRQNASEYQAQHGATVRNAVELYGVDRIALGAARKIMKLEDGKRQTAISHLLRYLEWLGGFDQKDAFNDLGAEVQALADRLKAKDAPEPEDGKPIKRTKPSKTLDELTSGKPFADDAVPPVH